MTNSITVSLPTPNSSNLTPSSSRPVLSRLHLKTEKARRTLHEFVWQPDANLQGAGAGSGRGHGLRTERRLRSLTAHEIGSIKGVPDAGELLPAIPPVPPRRTRTSSEAERPVDELPKVPMCVRSRPHVHGTDSLAGVASVRNAAGHTGRMDEVMMQSAAFSRMLCVVYLGRAQP